MPRSYDSVSVLFLKPYVKPFGAIINVFGLSITGE